MKKITEDETRLSVLEPAAARWISALIRFASEHPAMTRILDVLERMQDRPFRTNLLLLGEPGTGKDGLGRAFARLMAPRGPLCRVDLLGAADADALAMLLGHGRTPGLAEQAAGGVMMLEEAGALSPRVQTELLRLLKTGRVRRVGTTRDVDVAPISVVSLSDQDLEGAVAAGRFRHDLFHRLARVSLWVPPLRERTADIGPAAIWMGNRILAAQGVPLTLRSPQDCRNATAAERRRSIELSDEAVVALAGHGWTGNFRELEAVMERALMLYRAGDVLGADAIAAALATGTRQGVAPK